MAGFHAVVSERTITLAALALLLAATGCSDVNDPGISAGPQAVVMANDDDVSLYVSSDNTNSVLAYDGENGGFERKFARHGGLIEPEGITFGPDGNLYVASRSDEVLRFDGKTGK